MRQRYGDSTAAWCRLNSHAVANAWALPWVSRYLPPIHVHVQCPTLSNPAIFWCRIHVVSARTLPNIVSVAWRREHKESCLKCEEWWGSNKNFRTQWCIFWIFVTRARERFQCWRASSRGEEYGMKPLRSSRFVSLQLIYVWKKAEQLQQAWHRSCDRTQNLK